MQETVIALKVNSDINHTKNFYNPVVIKYNNIQLLV